MGAIKLQHCAAAVVDSMTQAQVAQALQEGRTVEPEFYQCVTIFFSDIVGFTAISGILQPHEVGLCREPADKMLVTARASATLKSPPEKLLAGWTMHSGLHCRCACCRKKRACLALVRLL